MALGNVGLIKACFDQLYAKKAPFSARVYERFFQKTPWAQQLFVHDAHKQEEMLFAVMTMITRGMDAGRDMQGQLEAFGRQHARLGVREELFPVFGAVLLETMIEFLPEWDHPQLAQAWWGVFTEVSEGVIDGLRAERAERAENHRLFHPVPKLISTAAR